MKKIIALVLSGLLLAGCGTPGAPKLDPNKVAADFYHQQQTRVYPAFQATNVDEYIIRGKGMTITVNTHMEPLTLIPREPTFWDAFIPTAGNVLQFGLGAWAANKAFSAIAAQPRVVEQPAPLVVRPEIVPVPTPIQ